MARVRSSFLILCVCIAFSLPHAKASSLLPGTVIPASQVTLPEGPAGDPFKYQVGYFNGVVSGPFTANYVIQVFADPANVYCAQCLDFMFSLGGITAGQIDQFAVTGFGGFNTDAGYGFGFGYGGVPPTTIARDATGNSITFNFGNPLSGSDRTAFLLVQTNAQIGQFKLQPGGGGTLNGLMTLEPVLATTPTPTVEAIPEPSTFVLLGTGLAGITTAIKKRLSR